MWNVYILGNAGLLLLELRIHPLWFNSLSADKKRTLLDIGPRTTNNNEPGVVNERRNESRSE